MISHSHKCIFIHISKCAGSSIETAFGVDVSDNTKKNNKNLFGWNEELKMHLQHATPCELLQNNLIEKGIWESYYKFIIVRNPWDRFYSDYSWMSREQDIIDSFYNYINAKGEFEKVLTQKNILYRGDHLKSQMEYFFYEGKKINYNRVIHFEDIKKGLNEVCLDLSLPNDFFIKKVNVRKNKDHYSLFYNKKRKKIIEEKFKDDIEYFKFSFNDKKNGLKDFVRSNLPSKFLIN